MRGLKVFLFISFLLTAIFGLIGLFSPSTMSSLGMAPKDTDPAYIRVFSTAVIAFSLAIWYTFRNPLKNVIIVRAVITWFGLEGLVLLINGITGATPWANALPGVISDWILAAGLAIFYPRGEKGT